MPMYYCNYRIICTFSISSNFSTLTVYYLYYLSELYAHCRNYIYFSFIIDVSFTFPIICIHQLQFEELKNNVTLQ